MKNVKLFLVIVGVVFFIICHAQTEETVLEIKSGLYVNWGNTKLNSADTLKCYSFDNMMLRVEIVEEMFDYDEIRFLVSYVVPYKRIMFSKQPHKSTTVYSYEKKYSKRKFAETFSEKTEASFWFIPPVGKKAHLISSYDAKPFTREKMANTSIKENVNTCFLKIEVIGRKISGYRLIYSESEQRELRYPVWSESIPLVNTLNSNPINAQAQYYIKKKDFVNIDMSKECYPYDGEKKITAPLR